jgi:hypothetical protein
MRVHEPPARGDTSGASAHNENLGIAAGHESFRGDLHRDVSLDRATHRAVPTISVRPVVPILSPRSPRRQPLFALTTSNASRAGRRGNVLRRAGVD